MKPAPLPPQPAANQPAAQREFSYLFAIVGSCYSKRLWRDVGVNWRGIGLLYMLLLLVITWLPVSIITTRGFYGFLEQDVPKLVNQVPAITITNGVVSIDKPEPYIISDPQTKRPIVIIDTTGGTTQLPKGVSALLTRSSIITRQNAGDTRVTDLSSVKSFSIDGPTIKDWVATIRFWFFPGIYVFAVIFSLAWRLLLMVLGGALAMLLASPFKAPITFAGAMRLSAIAMTPGILLSTLISLANFSGFGCFSFFLGLGLFALFLCLALHANASDAESGPRGFPILPPPNAPPSTVPPAPPTPPAPQI